MNQAESFTLVLTSVAPVNELEYWLAAAPAGHVVIYASGLDLPREAEAVKLVRGWAEAGLVHLTQGRDPDDRRRWQWRATRALGANPVPCKPARPAISPEIAEQKAALLDLLRGAGRECPSNRALARALGLAGPDGSVGQRGRNRVAYLLDLLVKDGAIELARRGEGVRSLMMGSKGE